MNTCTCGLNRPALYLTDNHCDFCIEQTLDEWDAK